MGNPWVPYSINNKSEYINVLLPRQPADEVV